MLATLYQRILSQQLCFKGLDLFADECSIIWTSWSCNGSVCVSFWNWSDRESVYLPRRLNLRVGPIEITYFDVKL